MLTKYSKPPRLADGWVWTWEIESCPAFEALSLRAPRVAHGPRGSKLVLKVSSPSGLWSVELEWWGPGSETQCTWSESGTSDDPEPAILLALRIFALAAPETIDGQ